MYIIDMKSPNNIIKDFPLTAFKPLLIRYAEILMWDIPSLLATHWRFYCPFESGGSITFKGKEYRLRRGMGVLIPTYTDFGAQMKHSFRKLYCHFHLNMPNLIFTPEIYIFDIQEDKLSAIEKLLEPETGKLRKEIQINAFTLEQIGAGLSLISLENCRIIPHDSRIEKACSFMRKNITAPKTNSQLAQYLKMDENYFVHRFKSVMGEPPQQHYMKIRLENAANLLLNSELSIEEIAERCGFWDRNHFSRVFRNKMLTPPAAYRHNNLNI
jgi:AraC-like DNA-binding protein